MTFAIAGCAMDPFASGPYIHVPESVDETHPEYYATIKTESENNHSIFGGLDHSVVLRMLDGVSLFKMRWDSDYPEECYLTEGYHEIDILYRFMNSYANGCFSLYAEPGKQYIVKNSLSDNRFNYWVEVDGIGKIRMGMCKPKQTN